MTTRLGTVCSASLLFLLAQLTSQPLPAWAESFTTNVLDGVTTNATGPFILGDSGPSNFLLITNGGALTNTTGIIGHQSGARANLAIVSGPGTVWENTGNFILGATGAVNTLQLNDGARFGSGAQVLSIGLDPASSNNVLQATGSNTFLDLTWFNLGDGGSGNQIIITEGAQAGRGISRDISNNIGVSNTSRSNLVVVAGAGSRLTGSPSVQVGVAGSANALVIADGAQVNSYTAAIGQGCVARDNVAFVTGTGTVWSNGLLEVGFCSTNNQLIISNGAVVLSGLVRSSVQGGFGNTITVADPGSLLRASGNFILGNSGTSNRLLIADGGRLEGRSDAIGFGGGGASALITGAGSSWTNLGDDRWNRSR